ncbi:MAG: alpha/beta fold hydrolase [Acidobacteria bacterium]|nr:alpha/beta fold hydrolase [Acidobacteriota bacterium]
MKRLLGAAVLGGVLAGSFLLGLFIADPIGLAGEINERRLAFAGARNESFLSHDGTRLRAITLGPLSAETPVVLLHGLGADATYWADAALFLKAQARTVVLLDLPGSGRSARPASPEGYGLPARVAAVEALAEALGFRRMDVVGHSLGGWTAASYALSYPRRIARLVLVDSGGFTPVKPEEVEELKRRLAPDNRTGATALVDLLFHRKPFPVAGFVRNAFGRNYRGPNVVVTLDQLSEKDGLVGREAELPRSTAIIWGAKEALFPLDDARRLSRLSGAPLHVLDGVGHDGPLEDPKAFHAALQRALASAESLAD